MMEHLSVAMSMTDFNTGWLGLLDHVIGHALSCSVLSVLHQDLCCLPATAVPISLFDAQSCA